MPVEKKSNTKITKCFAHFGLKVEKSDSKYHYVCVRYNIMCSWYYWGRWHML